MTDYQKQTWTDETPPPVDAQHLNHMEEGIDLAHSELEGHITLAQGVHGMPFGSGAISSGAVHSGHVAPPGFGSGQIAPAQVHKGHLAASVLAPDVWHEVLGGVGFQNNWVNYGGAYNTAAYRKDIFGRVYLKGLVKDGTTETTIFTLPVGYQPAAVEAMAADSDITGSDIEIDPDGDVRQAYGGTDYFALDGLTFFAA